MTLEDRFEMDCVYHVVCIVDLKKTLQEGIKYDDKNTYAGKYADFHNFFDLHKLGTIPDWVERRKAIFGSVGFKEGHNWHSHSAILRISIVRDRCWICNENLANFIYEPFMLQHMDGFERTKEYMRTKGKEFAEEYWRNSLSYNENLNKRYDKREGYDAEVLIMHSIPPQNIECLYIVSDHQIISYQDWKEYFVAGAPYAEAQYNRYLQPDNTSSAWKTPNLQ